MMRSNAFVFFSTSFLLFAFLILGLCSSVSFADDLLIASAGNLAADSDDENMSTTKKKVELLSRHITMAEFEGIEKFVCRGRTALCPDRCGHSGDMVQMKIIGYLKYEKPGKFPDEKQKEISFLLKDGDSDNQSDFVLSKENKDVLKKLKKGDVVLLNWKQEYVSENGMSFPVRTVTFLEPIDSDSDILKLIRKK